MPFDTPLSPQDELAFQEWKKVNAPYDSGEDYDLRGAYKAGLTPDIESGHWPDTFKKPNHPTFSDQSIYSGLTGTKPGSWEGNTYKPFGYDSQPNPFWKSLEGVVNSIRGTQISKAPWGFHEPTVTAGEGIGPLASATADVASDPRNAWMGLGPLAAMNRGMRLLRPTRELGGFNISTKNMPLHDTPRWPAHPQDAEQGYLGPMMLRGDIGYEQAHRDKFLDELNQWHMFANELSSPVSSMDHSAATTAYKLLQPKDQQTTRNVMKGMAELEGERSKILDPQGGGAVPPRWWLGYGR